MKRYRFTRFLVLIVLAAFLLAGVLAVLPHSHSTHSIGHNCLLCRAQSVQPDVAHQTSAATPLVFEEQLVVLQITPAFSEELSPFLLIRAPPVFALFSRG